MSDAVALGAVLVFSVVLAALTWGRWGDLTMDTGYELVAAARTAHGELPYVDYDYFYGPVGPLLLGGLYAITGTAVWPAVLLGLAMSVAAIVLGYRLAREFGGPVPSALAAALVAIAALSSANNSYVLPHSTSGPLVVLFVVAALLGLVRLARAEASTWRLVGTGALVGLALLTRLEVAVPLAIAVAAWLGLRVFVAAGAQARRAALRQAALILGPALALPVIGYGVFLTSVSPHDLVFDNLYPQGYLDAAGHVVLDAHAPRTVGSVAELIGRLVLYAGGIAAVVVGARMIAAGGRRRQLALLAAGGAALAFLAVLAARPETIRYYLEFAYGWIPAGAWVAVLIAGWRLRRARAQSGEEAGAWVLLLLGLVLGCVIATTYASFNPFPNALHPEATPYLLPLVAPFLVWLHVAWVGRQGNGAAAALGIGWLAVLAVASGVLMVRDARDETVKIEGPHGSLTARAADGPALQGVMAEIARTTRPGDRILLAPQLSALYVMSGRESPLREISLLPGMLDRRAEDVAIARLRDVRLVAIDRTPLSSYEHGAFGTTFDQRLDAAIRRDFRRLATYSGAGSAPRKIDLYVKDSP